MDGYAQAPEPGGLDDLASFLSDTPETESADEELAHDEAPPEEGTDAESDAQPEEAEAEDDTEAEAEEAEDTPTPERKIKVTLKGDDGTETEQEVSEDELVKGYHRQSDYTRKMQALSEREDQAVQFLKSKHNEVAKQYTEKAELTLRAVAQLAGLKSESDMAQLARDDPAAWVQENQRQQSISRYLQNLNQEIQGERQRMTQEQEQANAQAIEKQARKTWEVLANEKIDKPKLAAIYQDVNKQYGFSNEELSNVYDHRLVQMMRDATAYRALKAKTPEVTRKVTSAPPMPSKQATPAAERKQQAINARFKGGRAKLSDLAAHLMNN
jgi:hypothetical protein